MGFFKKNKDEDAEKISKLLCEATARLVRVEKPTPEQIAAHEERMKKMGQWADKQPWYRKKTK